MKARSPILAFNLSSSELPPWTRHVECQNWAPGFQSVQLIQVSQFSSVQNSSSNSNNSIGQSLPMPAHSGQAFSSKLRPHPQAQEESQQRPQRRDLWERCPWWKPTTTLRMQSMLRDAVQEESQQPPQRRACWERSLPAILVAMSPAIAHDCAAQPLFPISWSLEEPHFPRHFSQGPTIARPKLMDTHIRATHFVSKSFWNLLMWKTNDSRTKSRSNNWQIHANIKVFQRSDVFRFKIVLKLANVEKNQKEVHIKKSWKC